MKHLEELFAPPLGLKEVTRLEGLRIFSSDKIVKKFILMLEKTGRMRPYSKSLTDLVERGIVIPCFLSKGVVRFLVRKVTGYDGGVYALYYKPHSKVYVFLDADMTAWGTADNDELLKTTVHECMHVFADRKSRQYERVFMPVLVKYYSYVFSEFFQLKSINSSDVKKVIIEMRKIARSSSGLNKKLSNLYYMMEKMFKNNSELDENEFLKRVQDYIVLSKLTGSGAPIAVFHNMMRTRPPTFKQLFRVLYNGYSKAFGRRPAIENQFQETFYTSEVASQFAELFPTHSVVKKAIASI